METTAPGMERKVSEGVSENTENTSKVLVEQEEEQVAVDNPSMDEDLYGFAMTSIIRDMRMLSWYRGDKLLRTARLAMAQTLLVMSIFLQIFLLRSIKMYVTSKHVIDIRNVYDQYEFHMYGKDENHTVLTVNGKHRGIPEYFQPEAFDSLSEDLQSSVCRISISHPHFFIAVVLVWTLTCVGELKAVSENFIGFVWRTPTISSMRNSIAEKKEELDADAERGASYLEQRIDALEDNDHLIVGLTVPCKVYIACAICLPRLIVTCALLWLGCRWLLATIGFENILLNGVALEFVLLLKDLIYNTVVPARNKQDVQQTKRLPSAAETIQEKANYCNFLGSFAWMFLALAWAFTYTFYLQVVLPGYRWDVREVCTVWMATHFSLN